MEINWTPPYFIKKVGKGKTLSKSLEREEARSAMNQLLEGSFTPIQLGAFLQALRIRELSLEELLGFADVFSERAQKSPWTSKPKPDLLLNLTFDTSRKKSLLCLFAIPLLKKMGIQTGWITGQAPLTQNTLVYTESVKVVDAWANKFGYSDLSSLKKEGEFPIYELVEGLESLHDLRHEISFRSCLHTLEKITTPFPEVPYFTGISHVNYIDRLAQAMIEKKLNPGFILLGQHGTLDLSLQKETRCIVVKNSEFSKHFISSGSSFSAHWMEKIHQQSVDLWPQYWKESPEEFLYIVAYQAAFFLFGLGKTESVEQGLSQVLQSI